MASHPLPIMPYSDIRQDEIRKIDMQIEDVTAQLISFVERAPPAEPRSPHDRERILQLARPFYDQILTLRSTRNTLVPIARLHHEILQDIFMMVMRAWGSGGGKIALSLSWICRYWREIAIQTAGLWSHIKCRNPEWLETALTRTSGHELEFDYLIELKQLHRFQHLLPIWQDNMYRVRSITVHVYSITMEDISPPYLAWVTPAPCLVDLRLQRIKLPPNLFAGSCPSLQSLHLVSCDFSWSSLPAHEGMSTFSVSTSTAARVVDVLQTLRIIAPTIEEFRLGCPLLPFLRQDSEIISSRIHLPRITMFDVHSSSGGAIASLLDHLCFPQPIDLDIGASGGSLDDQFAVAQAVVNARGLSTWPVTHLRVDYGEEWLSLRVSESWKRYDPASNTTILRKIEVKLWLHRSDNDEISDLLPAFDVLPFSPITNLSFSGGYSDLHDKAIVEYFDRQDTVQSIKIETHFVPTFVSFVQDDNRRLRELTNITVPDLDMAFDAHTVELGLDVMSFHQLREITIDGDDGANKLARVYFTEFWEWLAWRDIFGLTLARLVFKDMEMPSPAMDLFEEVAQEVVFVDVEEDDEEWVDYNGNWPGR